VLLKSAKVALPLVNLHTMLSSVHVSCKVCPILQLNNNAFYIPFTGLNMAQSENAIDMIIVLGSHTSGEGSPSDMMKSRVDQAAQIYTSLKEQNIECRVIMTGYQRPEQVMGSCNS